MKIPGAHLRQQSSLRRRRRNSHDDDREGVIENAGENGDTPNTVNASVVRTRRYLTGREVEKLIEAARKHGRYGHRDEAAKACKVLRQLGDHISGVMVPIHHYGKDPARGLRGASAWSFNADMAIAVNADIAPDG